MDRMRMQDQPKKRDKTMTEIILAGLIGLLLGIGGATALDQRKPTEDKTSQTQQEIIKQLTNLDIVEKICAPEYIEKHSSDLLCRQLSCLAFSRGIDSQTSGKECEEISNVQNTISIIDYCKNQTEGTLCYDLFWRRK